MIWRALAAWGLSSLGGGGGATGRDLRSIPSIHWGDFLWNSADPADISGNASSATLANMMNPAGFSAGPPGLNPNNDVNPASGPTPAGAAPANPLTALTGGMGGGMGGMGGGIDPTQQSALYAAYNNFLRSIGQPGMTMPQPGSPPGPVSGGPSPMGPAGGEQRGPMRQPAGGGRGGGYPGLAQLASFLGQNRGMPLTYTP